MQNATKTRVLLVVAALFAGVTTAQAQERGQFSVEGRAGVGLPFGQMWDLTDPGGSVGGTLAYHFHPRFAVRGDVSYVRLDDGQDDFGVTLSPPMDIWFFGGGFEVNFGPPRWQDLPLTFAVNLGAGVSTMKVDDSFDPGHPANGFDNSYFTLNGGARIGYQVSSTVNLFVQGQTYLILPDSGDTVVFEDPAAGIEPFDTAWIVPLTGGIRLTF